MPGGGSAQAGRRPVVIVSNDVGNENSPVVIVAALTTKGAERGYAHDVQLPAGFPLPEAGRVMANQLVTLDKQFLGQYRASLSGIQLDYLNGALQVALGLPKPD
jgi:mRNA interferase MazF